MPEALDQSETSGMSVHIRDILHWPWALLEAPTYLSLCYVWFYSVLAEILQLSIVCRETLGWASASQEVLTIPIFQMIPGFSSPRLSLEGQLPWMGGWGKSQTLFMLLLLFMVLLTVFLSTGWMTVCCAWMTWTCPRWFTAGQWRPSRRRGQWCGCWSGGGRRHPRPFWRLTC